MARINKPNLSISRVKSKKAELHTGTIVAVIIGLVVLAIVMVSFSSLSAKGSKTTQQIQSTVTDVFPQLAGEDFYTLYLDGLYDPPVTFYIYVFANGTPRAGFSSMDFTVKDNNVTRIKTGFESYASQHIIFLVDSTDQTIVDNAKTAINDFLTKTPTGFNAYYSLSDYKGERTEIIDNQVVNALNVNTVNFTYNKEEIITGLENISADSTQSPYMLDAVNNALGRIATLNESQVEGEIDAKIIVLFPSTFTSSGPIEYNQGGTVISYTNEDLKKMIGSILNLPNVFVYVYDKSCTNDYTVLKKKTVPVEEDFSSDLSFLSDYTQIYCFNDIEILKTNLFMDVSRVKVTYEPLITEDTEHTIQVTLNAGGSFTGHGNLTGKTYVEDTD